MSVVPRLRRLFGPDDKCCEVAVDHGVHNEPSFLEGIEDLGKTVERLAGAGADAILLGSGQAHFLQEMKGRQRPSLVVRADATNFYGKPAPAHVFCELLANIGEQAVALDAAAILVNLIWAADEPELYHQCVGNVSTLKQQCERLGLPLMVEALLMRSNGDGQGYATDGDDILRSVGLVRQAVELGADVIKTDPPHDLKQFSRIVEAACGKPLLVRGGSRVSDSELLARTVAIMDAGAAGIVYGRNIYQHPQLERMLRACSVIVHEGARYADAERILLSRA